MGVIADWLDTRKSQIQQLVDTTNQDVVNGMLDDPLLDEYFPIQTYMDFKILWLKFKNVAAIASVVGFEGEIPGTRTGNITEAELEVFKLGIAHHYTENLLIMMHEFEQRSLAVPALMTELKNILFGSIDDLKPRLNGLMKLMVWQVLYSGSCDYLDPRTKIRARIDYEKEATLFPAALTGTRRWSQPTTATGIQDLVNLMEAYYLIHRRFPDKLIMSRNAVNKLLAQDATRAAAIARTVSAATASQYVVSRELLNMLLMDRQVPPIEEYDRNVVVENTDGTTTNTRLIPENRFLFLSKMMGGSGKMMGMGERALGPVPSNKMKPGISTFSEEVSKEPPVDRSVGVCTFVPAIFDPRCLSAQQIDT